jgi:hypothetical protein
MSMSILTDYLGRMRMLPVLLFDEVNSEMGALAHFFENIWFKSNYKRQKNSQFNNEKIVSVDT